MNTMPYMHDILFHNKCTNYYVLMQQLANVLSFYAPMIKLHLFFTNIYLQYKLYTYNDNKNPTIS